MRIGLLGFASVDCCSAVSTDFRAVMCVDYCSIMSVGFGSFHVCRFVQCYVHRFASLGLLQRCVPRLLPCTRDAVAVSCPNILLRFMPIDFCGVMSVALLGFTSVYLL